MKTIQSLLVSLFAVLLIASCDNSVSPDTKSESQRIGTWMVYDTEAEWVGSGSQSKAKTSTLQAEGDTISIDYPDGINVYLVDEGDRFLLFYQDSSYNDTNRPERISMSNPLRTGTAIGISYSDDHIEVTNRAHVKCDSTYSDTENMIVSYYKATDERPIPDSLFIEATELNTTGIVASAKSIRCP